jgi:hypothetical protein
MLPGCGNYWPEVMLFRAGLQMAEGDRFVSKSDYFFLFLR